MVTGVPGFPPVGERLAIPSVTVKLTPLLAKPPAVTTAFPVAAPTGTGTTMLVLLQLVGDAGTPLNVTVLAPCVAPNVVPVIVIDVPTTPLAGDRFVMPGTTPKYAPLLAKPPTVTTTFPVVAPTGTGTTTLVALQLVGDAETPLNATVLAPCVAPKLVPVIVTAAPVAAPGGDKLAMFGTTPKLTPLLGKPATVTKTFPVMAPAGTGTTMLVALQLVGVARVP
jgi:hypothetical protein